MSTLRYNRVPPPTFTETNGINRCSFRCSFPLRNNLSGSSGVVIAAIIGIMFGIFLQYVEIGLDLLSWVELPGVLFINVLKCLVSPLVFCSLVEGMADLLKVGKASAIGWRTAVLYILTMLVASIQGLLWVLLFKSSFSQKETDTHGKPTVLALQCNNKKYLTMTSNGVTCTSDDFSQNSTQFLISDINNILKLNSNHLEKLSLSQSLQGQLKEMITDNIFGAFAQGNLLSIVMFALPFGVAVASLPEEEDNRLLDLLRQTNLVFMKMVSAVISLTPIAVFFMISSSLAANKDLGGLIQDVGLLIALVLFGLLLHNIVALPCLLALVIRSNPFPYVRQMIPAQLFALGCSSSMATLPMTMKCVESTNEVPKTLATFVLSLGATVNMDGAALFYPVAIIFMAETAGLGHYLGVVEILLLVLISTLGAVGSAPVPSAGLVMVVTIWNSIFPYLDLPSSFTYIVATDWILDRFITVVNVTGDTIVARMVAELVPGATEMATLSTTSSKEDCLSSN